MIGFVSSRTSQPLPLESTVDGEVVEVVLPARVLVNIADTSAAAAKLELGIVQARRFGFAGNLASGGPSKSCLHFFRREHRYQSFTPTTGNSLPAFGCSLTGLSRSWSPSSSRSQPIARNRNDGNRVPPLLGASVARGGEDCLGEFCLRLADHQWRPPLGKQLLDQIEVDSIEQNVRRVPCIDDRPF